MTDERQPAWLAAASQVVAAVQASDVADFILVRGDFRIHVRRAVTASSSSFPSGAAAAPGDEGESQLHRVQAPLTGIFYRSPSPAANAYVAEDDWVDAETVIGLIETMKIFNEVTADREGRVRRFLVQDGQLVQAGDPLLLLEPGGRSAAHLDAGG